MRIRFSLILILCTIFYGTANAGYATIKETDSLGYISPGSIINLTTGNSYAFNVMSSFVDQSFYSTYTPSYYFSGYGGYISVTGFGTAGNGGYQGPMTFFNSETDSNVGPANITTTVSGPVGSAQPASIAGATVDLSFTEVGTYTISTTSMFNYTKNIASQSCGGSAWGSWGFGTLAWCTNPTSTNQTSNAIASVSEQFTVMVTNPVPEPERYALLLAGLGLIGAGAKRRKARQE